MAVADYSALEPYLVKVDLVRSQALVHCGQAIEHCWFLEEGIASIVVMSSEGHETEAGIVGHDGMVDVATILGVSASTSRAFIQIAGYGYRLPIATLIQRLEESADLRALLNRYAYDCLTQLSYTALANASFTVEERLARWLLMCADRLGSDEIALTHDFLSVMLNVRRAGVTEALNALGKAKLIKTRRGAIQIIDSAGLSRMVHDADAPRIGVISGR